MNLLTEVDAYLHAAPLSGATAEEVGPFTLFRSTVVWPYYARPRPGSEQTIEAADLEQLRKRCAELDLPLNLEWVVETCPSLSAAAAAAGLEVVEHPLLVLDPAEFKPTTAAATVTILPAIESVLREARAVASVAFGNPGTAVGDGGIEDRKAKTAEVTPEMAKMLLDRAQAGFSITAGAATEDGLVASGVHQPVGKASEIVGVATLPTMRRQGLAAAVTSCLAEHAFAMGVTLVLLSAESDAVAAVYERVGFRRIGHAGAAEVPADK
ncbi:GNAT family N-acetyltransferase [Kribbella qitaiheensis]|uniref:GNAT family N-acetyltransferase n=1 Tax=Kribbella qitaiheensis TaxID=1544730 RepID=A0A7G6WXZ2_9ACTN|nr:GNAT family N-acetyltransferase [Kribbella qitaiheensis]QNE18857.1 GNAT family N-acetyltransferase [Kribbella qitaiheensis]